MRVFGERGKEERKTKIEYGKREMGKTERDAKRKKKYESERKEGKGRETTAKRELCLCSQGIKGFSNEHLKLFFSFSTQGLCSFQLYREKKKNNKLEGPLTFRTVTQSLKRKKNYLFPLHPSPSCFYSYSLYPLSILFNPFRSFFLLLSPLLSAMINLKKKNK